MVSLLSSLGIAKVCDVAPVVDDVLMSWRHDVMEILARCLKHGVP